MMRCYSRELRRAIGAVLRELRGKRSVKAIALAYRTSSAQQDDLAGPCSTELIVKLERGWWPLKRPQLERVARALDTTAERVLELAAARLERLELLRSAAEKQGRTRRTHRRSDEVAILAAAEHAK